MKKHTGLITRFLVYTCCFWGGTLLAMPFQQESAEGLEVLPGCSTVPPTKTVNGVTYSYPLQMGGYFFTSPNGHAYFSCRRYFPWPDAPEALHSIWLFDGVRIKETGLNYTAKVDADSTFLTIHEAPASPNSYTIHCGIAYANGVKLCSPESTTLYVVTSFTAGDLSAQIITPLPCAKKTARPFGAMPKPGAGR